MSHPRGFLAVAVVALVVLVGAPGCGKYARRGDSKPAPTGDVSVGEDIDPLTSPTRALDARPTTTVGDENGDGRPLASNQTRYTSPEGFEFTLTVDGPLRYTATDSITMDVLVRNVSKQDLQFDPNNLQNFAFRAIGSADAAWTDGMCRAARVAKAVEGPAQTLHPNEQSAFRDTYPGPPDFANRDQCRVRRGSYAVFGFVAWCPPGSTDGRGACDAGKTKQISSAGVRITII